MLRQIGDDANRRAPRRDSTPEDRSVSAQVFGILAIASALELAMVLGDAIIVLVAATAAAFAAGLLLRGWLVVPLLPIAILLLLNIHVRIFGEIIEIDPIDEHMAGSVDFWYAIWLAAFSTFAVLVGTVAGKASRQSGR